MARRRHTRVLPLDLYERYPHAALLPITPPTPLTAWAEWRVYALNCGDGLFSFLICELADSQDWNDALSRMDSVLNDVMSVHEHISRLAESN